jgi:hypothetical protein
MSTQLTTTPLDSTFGDLMPPGRVEIREGYAEVGDQRLQTPPPHGPQSSIKKGVNGSSPSEGLLGWNCWRCHHYAITGTPTTLCAGVESLNQRIPDVGNHVRGMSNRAAPQRLKPA